MVRTVATIPLHCEHAQHVPKVFCAGGGYALPVIFAAAQRHVGERREPRVTAAAALEDPVAGVEREIARCDRQPAAARDPRVSARR